MICVICQLGAKNILPLIFVLTIVTHVYISDIYNIYA